MNKDKIYDNVHGRALRLGYKIRPKAPDENHEAFANAVAFAMTGITEGCHGPSMRERLANGMIVDLFGPYKKGRSRCSFEKAVDVAALCCYGKLTMAHARLFDDSRDNSKSDVRAAKRLLSEQIREENGDDRL